MELIFIVIGIVWIIGSCQFIKEKISETLYGLSGDKLYKNLINNAPERYGKDLSFAEKFCRIFFSIVLGIIFIIGGLVVIYIAICNLHTWLPK